jgi:decaprenylphospho-beta-D-erythro-pentofuranosid-2-ulose 2-reductase
MNNSTQVVMAFGATSAIAQATLRLFAQEKASFFLVSRNEQNLQSVKLDLMAHGAADCETLVCDAMTLKNVSADLVGKAVERFGNIDIALLAHGVLGDQNAMALDPKEAEELLQINFISHVYILTHLANYFAMRKAGKIVCISSVAGDRGRKSNYIYGSSKAALSTFVQGLRGRLAKDGVQVMTVKPGFVDTPTTSHLKKTPLFAKPETVASDIKEGLRRGTMILYTPRKWRFIMLIIKLIPERIFKSLSRY